jgi:2-(1,2-epoxy-1,2-dihydrophenyl)acetyl-CoA isomerase
MEYKQKNILVEIDDAVATVVLNRPEKYNAMNEETVDEYSEVFRMVSADDQIRAVIVTGAGKAFCAGADRSSHIFNMEGPSEFWVFMQKISRMILQIRGLSKPVIAAINGPAVGGGCNMALACDIIIASQAASFRQIYVQIGIHPDSGGTYFLPRLVGTAKACELMFTGRAVSAPEALEIGLVNQVVPPDKLLETARNLAKEIAGRSPLAIKMIKSSIYDSLESDLETVLELEAKALSVLMYSEDHKEAISALVEKRQPVFKGK